MKHSDYLQIIFLKETINVKQTYANEIGNKIEHCEMVREYENEPEKPSEAFKAAHNT